VQENIKPGGNKMKKLLTSMMVVVVRLPRENFPPREAGDF